MSEIITLSALDIENKIKNIDIVIFEEDKDTNDLLKLKLELSGFKKVISFTDSNDLLKFVEKGKLPETCLFILDIVFTSKDEFATYKKILTERKCPFIIISAIPSSKEIVKVLGMGASDVIVKPFDMGVFLLKIEKVLTEYLYDRNLSATYKRNQRLFLNVLQVMARVTEVRFPFIQFHSENVARYSRLLGSMVGLTSDRIRLLSIAGILHDLGKIGVTEEILNKPGKLTEEEYEIVKQHPVIASEVLHPISEMNIVLMDVRHHHEWFDGNGYPDRISGESIPVGARILHIAEAYDTMIGQRVYKEAYPKERAIGELLDNSGGQFDSDLVSVFVEYLKK